MIIDCIGCLHGFEPKLKGGDFLIVTGDLTARDKIEQYSDFFSWFCSQNYSHKFLIAGNHDTEIEKGLNFSFADERIHYLEDSGIEVEGLKIWGSPWSAAFKGINPKCKAFTENFGCDTDELLDEHWREIPLDVDILITHTPPYGILDGIPIEDGSLYHTGSSSLLKRVKEIKPKLHVFSHIHEQGGKKFTLNHDPLNTFCVNCSIMNERYKPLNKPIRIIL